MSAPTRPRQSFWDSLQEPRTVVSLLLLYCAVHVLLRFLLSPNLYLGEAEQMLFGQSFRWSYRPDHSPLDNWVSWATLAASQNSRVALFLLREAVLALGLIAYFAAARAMIGETRRAALAAFLLLATFGMGWLVHVGSVETVLLAALCAAYLWADVRALTRGAIGDYVLLGVVTGLGVLSSYVFLVLPFGMSVAAAMTPELRARLRLPPLAVAAAVALVIVAPHVYFAPYAFAGSAAGTFSAFASLRDFALALIVFALPAVLVFPALYPRAAKPLRGEDREQTWLRFLKIAMLAALIVAAAAMLLFHADDAKASWVYPVLLPLPIYLFLRAQLAYGSETQARDKRIAGVIVLCVVAAVAGRIWSYETHAAGCKHCREYWPMPRYADAFRQAGFLGGTIAAPEVGLAGNLRLSFPDARVVTPQAPARAFGPPVPGECLIVWRGDGNVPQRLRTYVTQTYGAKLEDRAMQGDVEATLLTSKTRKERMNFLILAQGACDKPRP
jgi:4-amino-4-deoxy-L-arabinose transferase-like glycosyltransferase